MKTLTLQMRSTDFDKLKNQEIVYFDQLLKMNIQIQLVYRNITPTEKEVNQYLINKEGNNE